MKNYFGEEVHESSIGNHDKKELSIEALKLGYVGNSKSSEIQLEVEELLESYRPGDRIVFHSSPQEEWQNGCGSEGIALLRDGYFIKSIILRMN